MRPIFLKLCGINSFSEPAEVDFSALLDQGVFGIFGDTGSGKSTILDCIGFALYGNVSRSGTNAADVINFRCEKGTVEFVFEIFYEGERRTFRVEREIRRKKDGSTVQSLCVYESIDGKLLIRESGVREGNAFLLGVIGLKQDDFEKCIALPQGEFARFIKEAPGKRLEIVSRLFDLERFGNDLSRRASARSAALTQETQILSARMERYADVSEERISSMREEIAVRTAAEGRLSAVIASKRESEKKLHALVDRRREYERVCAEKAALDRGREEMEKLEGELGRLETAKAFLSAEKERAECEKLYLDARRRHDYAARQMEEAERLRASLPAFDEEACARAIEELTLARGKAELKARAEQEKAAAERELAACMQKAEALRRETADPDYENQLKALLALEEDLGAGDLYAFLASKKDALYRGEYRRFAAELSRLQGKYPVIAPDGGPLIERYTALSEGETLEFSDLKGAFEARERAKRAAETARLDLERANSRFRINQNALSSLNERIAALRESIAKCGERIGGAPDLKKIEEEIAAKKRAREDYLAAKAKAERERGSAELLLASSSADEAARSEALQRATDRLAQLKGDFADAEEAAALVSRYGDAAAAKERLGRYRDRSAAVSSKYEELAATDYSAATAEGLAAVQGELASLEEERSANAAALAVLCEDEKRSVGMLGEEKALAEEYEKKQRESETAQRLLSLLRGGKFMEFVAEEYLQTVALNASVQLLSLSGGRYFLRYLSGGFSVGDNFNGGELRSVGTLSGGETFLVSLSLALALSSEICARSSRPIEFFFLDEGFGTLDEKLVDTVMDSLEKLRSKSFSIGIISHVEELKHRIERKLLVQKATEERGSRIAAE